MFSTFTRKFLGENYGNFCGKFDKLKKRRKIPAQINSIHIASVDNIFSDYLSENTIAGRDRKSPGSKSPISITC